MNAGIIRCILVLLMTVIFANCSGIHLLSSSKKSDLYRESFLAEVKIIKQLYKSGESDQAYYKLAGMNDHQLLPTEKALKRTLIGVITFSRKNYEKAITHFELALSTSRLDDSLTAQIHLNIASSYYKLGSIDKSYALLKMMDSTKLSAQENRNYYLLRYNLAKELGKEGRELAVLVKYLQDKKKLKDLKANYYFGELLSGYFKLEKRDRLRLLEEFDDDPYLVVSYLGYLEAEKSHYNGEKDEARELLDWVIDRSNDYKNNDIRDLVENFKYKTSKSGKINPNVIGVVLPLTGKLKTYGQRALLGIDSGLKEIISDKDDKTPYKLFIKDSQGSGMVGSFRVREMIEKHHASVIIGGLFSDEAAKEYLEAKEHGAFFVSLSQIYLPADQKDHLLLEIPGSVESQLEQLFSPEMLNKFGKKAAIICSKDARGEAYISGFWKKATDMGVEVNGILTYDKKRTDHRNLVASLLGLRFHRERQEELDIFQEIYQLESNTSARRIQTLDPQIDFDWIFVPAFPKKAVQIIPNFSYFDAPRLNLIGSPSWRSQRLSKESQKLGRLYFIGDDVQLGDHQFFDNFKRLYKSRPRLIELGAYDAVKIVYSIIKDPDFTTRGELDGHIRDTDNLDGITGSWKKDTDLWIKELVSLQLKRGKIEKVVYEE